MHELAVCRALVAQLASVAHEHGAARVSAVKVLVGPLSGVEPALLRSAFPLAAAVGVAEGAELQVEEPALRIGCDECGAEGVAPPNHLLCGRCGGRHTRILSGDELLLASVELETSDV